MSTASLVAAVKKALPQAVSTNLTSQTAPWDAYEAYAMMKVVTSAATDGYVARLTRLQKAPGPQFVFRRGPGQIYSPNFSYVLLTHGQTELEVHVGVGVEGQSRVVHEADVSVVEHFEAEQARVHRFAPRARALVLLFECKYYSGNLDLGLLREYLGLTTDLRSQNIKHWLVSNVSHGDLPTLLKHHNRGWADQVMPGTSGERRLVAEVETLLHRHRR